MTPDELKFVHNVLREVMNEAIGRRKGWWRDDHVVDYAGLSERNHKNYLQASQILSRARWPTPEDAGHEIAVHQQDTRRSARS